MCALPFLKMHKATKMSDPCLELHRKQQEKMFSFCTGLEHQRSNVNHRSKYKKEILSSLEMLKKNSSNESLQNVRIPEKIVELSKEIPQFMPISDTNFSYAGGCLVHSYSDDSPVLLHPSGKRLNKLSIIPLEENGTAEKRFNPKVCSQHFVKLRGETILQISSASNGICYVRQKESIHFINFMNLNEIQTDTMKGVGAVNIAASPYNPLELLSLFPDGKLKLKNIETRKVTNVSKIVCDEALMEYPRGCSFGSQPFSFLSLSNHQLLLYDLRLKSKPTCSLFSTQHPSCYLKEELSVLKTLSSNTFQHFAASNNHLFLCDERYPKEPVMLWNHLLGSHPLYCSNTEYCSSSLLPSSDVFVLLSTQVSREICAISLKSSVSEVQPTTLTLPFFLSSPSDCIEALKLQCVFVDNSQCARFYNSIIGLSAVPHTKSNGFTCFQLSSLGDVFYQDFYESSEETLINFRNGPGCVLPPVDKITSQLSYLNLDQMQLDEQKSTDSLTHIDADLKDILKFPKEISADCILCRCEQNEKEFVFSDVCPFCGLNNLQSKQLSEAATNLNVIGSDSGRINLNVNIEALSEFTDSCSKNILECWLSDSNVVPEDMDLSDLCTETGFNTQSTVSEKGANASSSLGDLEMQLDPRTVFTDSFCNELFESADYSKELIPSSQDIRPLQGETLHTPLKPKVKFARKSTAGF
ncbi:uncharacterized protein LOC129223979 [Uloborus diversus]|uniref:uncharacterized protein LOC129223979 n=1 Tax=Uloborus diversus TaxID=327109 RepID=UPI00240A4D3A|nr:uncharacterized protein LOC129223979 [Uloborus diversus]